MVGIKGNNGKSQSPIKQLFIAAVIAIGVIGTVKIFGTGSWHNKPVMDDHGQERQVVNTQNVNVGASHVKSANVADITISKEKVGKDIADNNLIQFVFSYLDGVEGHEGEVVVKLRPEWSPIAVKRIKELTIDSFWDECRAFRVVPNFVVQLGINGDPQKQRKWKQTIPDETSVKGSNTRGTVTFAMAGPNTRTTQIFFNTVNNKRLDAENFAPFGEVISGMDIIDRINNEYREKPNQGKIQQHGNEYLKKNFPKMSYIKSARFISTS